MQGGFFMERNMGNKRYKRKCYFCHEKKNRETFYFKAGFELLNKGKCHEISYFSLGVINWVKIAVCIKIIARILKGE
jgi:hypothetical protein